MNDPGIKYFNLFCEIATPGKLEEFLVKKPVLFSPAQRQKIITYIKNLPEAKQENAILHDYYLEEIFLKFNSIDNYPLEKGPLENIFNQFKSGEISLNTATKLASASDINERVSPLYIQCLSVYTEKLASENLPGAENALAFSDIILSAIEAMPNNEKIESEWFQMWSQMILSKITATQYFLMQIADKRKLDLAENDGLRLLEKCNPQIHQNKIGTTNQRLGLLYLDPIFSKYTNTDFLYKLKEWQQAAFNFYDKRNENVTREELQMPAPEIALKKAKDYLLKALPFRDGLLKAYTVKALAEVYMHENNLSGNTDFSQIIQLAKEGIQLFEAADKYPEEYVNLQSMLAFYSKTNEKNLTDKNKIYDHLLKDDPEVLLAEYGQLSLFSMFQQAIQLALNNDATTAFILWVKAQQLLDQYHFEEPAETHFYLGTRVLTESFVVPYYNEIIDLPTKQLYEKLKDFFSKNTIAAEYKYATFMLAAFASLNKTDEQEGIEILTENFNEFSKLELLQPFIPLCSFMLANMYLNVGIDYYNNKNYDNAITGFFSSLYLFIGFQHTNTSLDILEKIEMITQRCEQGIFNKLVGSLCQVALSLERLNDPAISQKCQEIYKIISQGLAEANKTDLQILFFLVQLTKGYAYNVMLNKEIKLLPGNDYSVDETLRRIKILSNETGAKLYKNNHAFLTNEMLLVSYSGSAITEEGDDTLIKLENLKKVFDHAFYQNQLIADVQNTNLYLLVLKDIQACLDEESVLICQLIAPSAKGQSALYNIILTSEEASLVIGGLADIPSSVKEYSAGNIFVKMAVIAESIAATRSEIQEEPETEGLTHKGFDLMKKDAAFYLGGNIPKILDQLKKKNKNHLIVWPHGPLHFYPFHLLPLNAQPICTDWKVTYIPNISILTRIDKSSYVIPGEKFIASMGISFIENKDFPFLRPLKNSIQEATSIAKIFNLQPIVEENVSEESFIQTLKESSWVHLSTHGMFDANAPTFHCLFLQKNAQGDGIFNAYELAGLDLSHVQLLTLSACETALGRFDLSDNMRGLPAMFLQAGVSTIIGTLWEAEAQCCETFFVALYTELEKGKSKTESFASAQDVTRKAFPDYRDWGAFYYTGNI